MDCPDVDVGKSKADRKRKEERDRKERKKEEKRAKEKADDPKAGADVGKIVNLMAGDANKVTPTCIRMLSLIIIFGRYHKWCRGRTSFTGVSTKFVYWSYFNEVTLMYFMEL